MSCKTYGVIEGLEIVNMANGRTRAKGTCSVQGCGGRISKIVS